MSTPFYRRISLRRKRRPQAAARPELSVEQILAWADAHQRRTKTWPKRNSGLVADASDESWHYIDTALRNGTRGLRGGSSVAKLLAEHRGVRNPADLPHISPRQVLEWADAFHRRTGSWPNGDSGAIQDCLGENWRGLDAALIKGLRGLSGGSSLARFLARHRGARNRRDLPKLSQSKILRWADAHHQRTGRWPKCHDGPISSAPGETWMAVEMALSKGNRGLTGGSSLPRLLEAKRGVPNKMTLRPVPRRQILAWADAHYRRTGKWPTVDSGAIREGDGETWRAVDKWLRYGRRRLQAGSSLARLLAKYRAVSNPQDLPRLTIKQILSWADAHRRLAGRWPTQYTGPVAGVPHLTWSAVGQSLSYGLRGLPGGSSLRRLFAKRRGLRNSYDLTPLTERQVLAWADTHRRRTGNWPTFRSGRVEGGPNRETWLTIDKALRRGKRGLPHGSSLARLLAARRGVRNLRALPPLTLPQILAWAQQHRRRTGLWPTANSGLVPGSDGTTWHAIDNSLLKGYRGLPGGMTLRRLIERGRRQMDFGKNND